LVLVYFGTIETTTSNKESFFDGIYGNFSEDFQFHIINVEAYPELANKMKIYDFPKIVLYYKGKEVDRVNAPFSPFRLFRMVLRIAGVITPGTNRAKSIESTKGNPSAMKKSVDAGPGIIIKKSSWLANATPKEISIAMENPIQIIPMFFWGFVRSIKKRL
jgi:thiol-disulfide isomerase/thioredoxin